MFDDIIEQKNINKKVAKKRTGDVTIPIEFLEDVQEIMWDLATEPCIFCGQDTGTQHKDTCSYTLVMEELDYQLLKHRRS